MGAALVPLQNITLGSAAASVTFASIPTSGYRDLRIVYSGTRSASDIAMRFRLNGDTGSNYSLVYMIGTGSTTGSGTASSTFLEGGYFGTSGQGDSQINIFDGNATDKHKTALVRSNDATTGGGTLAYSGRWASTSAITSINLFTSSGTFSAGSTFALYGVVA